MSGHDLELRYERLYGDELFERIDERPLAWLPLGILEHHGPESASARSIAGRFG